MNDYNKILSKLNIADKIITLLNEKSAISIKYLAGSSKAALIGALKEKLDKSIFVITPSNDIAADWNHDLRFFLQSHDVVLLTEPKSSVKIDNDNSDERAFWIADGLSQILNAKNPIVVTTPSIFTINMPLPENITENNYEIKVGQSLNYEDFINMLCLNGFDRKEFVEMQGDIAVRGGLIDIFPIAFENPIRVEFWGNDIESIREFDTLSQRSTKKFDKIEFVSKIFGSQDNRVTCSIYNYIPDNALFIIDSPESIEQDYAEFQVPEQFNSIVVNPITHSDFTVITHPQPSFMGSVKRLALELQQLAYKNTQIMLCCESKIHSERLKELIENAMDNPEDNLTVDSIGIANSKKTLDKISWFDHTPSNGFLVEGLGVACFTEHQIFNRIRVQDDRRRRKKYSGGISLRELKQLNRGDWIVHEDKGIGKFDGFETITLGSNLQECVRIRYAEDDLLYVNLNYIHKIQKYTAQEGVLPKLTKLGSAEWERKKARTKKRLKDIARELIILYAKRKMTRGISFPADTMWQKEFEASFIYEDTPDQATTTDLVKKDMESENPMDRLVCGDVGFGKTEVAMRAAFKAVEAGKQVGVLVPTTILAQQHYMTFKDRMSKYPFNIEAISRFRTTAEQKVIINNTKDGKVDILIGTHRLLSKDIQFKDLGLLVIDEEHRFGVGAKEKLRQIKNNVDTLTLTATPIPRTLNFSLLGARDLSVIETPPRNRLPIITEVTFWNEQLLQKAIDFEVNRGGQVFFVNDRINDMEKIKATLNILMPTVRFAIAHGQMTSSELEKIMEQFVSRKFDVLLATKIVESGLDIPNANTIIINRAQNFGLAELYQLRGRVGRSNTQAFCYLLIPPGKTLPQNSLRRLQALEEFTELGSGFQLSMRDLEIRGAGNLLGPEQSGYINEIGFDLFHKVLDEAVQELRVEEFPDLFKDKEFEKHNPYQNEDVAIEIDSDALLPASYINNDTERFYFYKQLYNCKNKEELDKIVEEIQDRFGKLPKEAQELVFVVKLRTFAVATGFSRVNLKKGIFVAEFPPATNKQYYEQVFPMVLEYLQELPNVKLKEVRKNLYMEAKVNNRDDAINILWRIKKTVELV